MASSDRTRRAFLKRTAGLVAAPYLLASCTPETPDAADTLDASVGEDGFITLFNGENLDGWHINRERIWHGTGGRWAVEDGVIVGAQDPPGSGNGGILLTDQTFGDFELVLDVLPAWGADSGLFLRATEQGQCFQVMIDYLEGGIVGQIYGEGIGAFGSSPFRIHAVEDESGRLTGFTATPNEGYDDHPLTYTCSPEEWIAAWQIDTWNTLRVRCEGQYPTITTWINDTHICTFDGAVYTHPRYDREEVYETLGRAGHVALQVHGGSNRWPADGVNRWRNIRIKPLG